MMTSYFNLLKYAATGHASPDMTYFDKLRASTLMGGGTVQTLTGQPPLTFKADGTPLISWSMKGNGQQTGTPTPDAPIMPEFVGVRTAQLWDKGVPLYSYSKDYKKYNPDNAIALKAGIYTISSDGKLPIIQVFDANHTQLLVSGVINYTSNYYSMWDELAIGPISAVAHATTITLLSDCILTFTVTDNLGAYIMLNLGSTALPYEPYGWKVPFENHGENLFNIDGKNTENGYQNNTQLYADGSTAYWSNGEISEYITVDGDTQYTLTNMGSYNAPAYCFYTENKEYISGSGFNGRSVITFTTPSNCKYVRITHVKTQPKTMLTPGSEVKPYSPYLNETLPVYLGEVPTVRRVKKLVLDGTEDWWYSPVSPPLLNRFACDDIVLSTADYTIGYSTHYIYEYKNDYNRIFHASNMRRLYICDDRYSSADDFKSYLASEYAAGHPVTIWCVLANEQTAISNEPLAKIGDYCDELHSTDAAVTIPTAKGANTLTVESELQLSEMTIKYHE